VYAKVCYVSSENDASSSLAEALAEIIIDREKVGFRVNP